MYGCEHWLHQNKFFNLTCLLSLLKHLNVKTFFCLKNLEISTEMLLTLPVLLIVSFCDGFVSKQERRLNKALGNQITSSCDNS